MKPRIFLISLLLGCMTLFSQATAQPKASSLTMSPYDLYAVCTKNVGDAIQYVKLFTFDVEKDGVPISHPNTFLTINSQNISPNTSYTIYFRDVLLDVRIPYNIVTQSSSFSKIQCEINMSSFASNGVFRVEYVQAGSTLTNSVLDGFFSIGCVKTVKTSPYNVMLHYNKNYLVKYPNIVTEVVTAINNAWDKQINDWKLCDKLNQHYPTVPNGENFDFVLNDFDNPLALSYENTPFGLLPQNNQKRIMIPYNIKNNLEIPNANEQDVFSSIVCHEFYHCIQYSYMPVTEIADKNSVTRQWLLDGQARALETVFMNEKTKTAGVNNYMFQPSSANISYEQDCKAFINNYFSFNTVVGMPSPLNNIYPLQKIGYGYALFWRYLYENNTHAVAPTTTPINPNIAKLAIFPATCKALATINSSSDLAIKTIMDAQLANDSGAITNFSQALTDFAEKTYLHSSKWNNVNVGSKPLKKWDNPNSNDFYKTITTNPGTTTRTFPEPTCPAGDLESNYNALKPFQSISLSFGFVSSCLAQVTFKHEPTSKYEVTAILTNTEGTGVFDIMKMEINEAGIGNLYVSVKKVTANMKVNIIITRTDCNTNAAATYKLNVRQAPSSVITEEIGCSWDRTVDAYKLNFADISTIKNTNRNVTWNLGDNVTSTNANPTRTVTKSGFFTVEKNVEINGNVFKFKKNVNILPPFIQEVKVYSEGSSIEDIRFLRYLKYNVFCFDRFGEGVIATGINVSVKAHSILPLKSLTLEILDGDGKSLWTISLTPEANEDKYQWDFTIPKEKLQSGFHYLQFIGKDRNDNDLIYLEQPPMPAITYPADNLNFETFTKIKNMTLLPDKSYHIFIKPPLDDNKTGSYIQDNCNMNQAVFTNGTKESYIIKFGDGNESVLPANSMVTHNYSANGSYTAEIVKRAITTATADEVIESKTLVFSL